jgi:hypothetical protein
MIEKAEVGEAGTDAMRGTTTRMNGAVIAKTTMIAVTTEIGAVAVESVAMETEAEVAATRIDVRVTEKGSRLWTGSGARDVETKGLIAEIGTTSVFREIEPAKLYDTIALIENRYYDR